MSLTPCDLARYDRHFRIPGFTEPMQQALQQSSVLVVGAGGLGCPVLQYLAASGVGRLGIVDPDRVSVSNLQRQVLYCDGDLGKFKALMAAQRIRVMNPSIKVDVYSEWLTDELADELFPNYDLVVGATDSYLSRYLIDRKSIQHQLAFVHGAIADYEGQVSVFNYQGSISYSDVFGTEQIPSTGPTGVIGAVAGVVGSMMALEAIKIITGHARVMCDCLTLYCGFDNTFRCVKY